MKCNANNNVQFILFGTDNFIGGQYTRKIVMQTAIVLIAFFGVFAHSDIASARCLRSHEYHVKFRVTSCEDRNHEFLHGAILEISVTYMKEMIANDLEGANKASANRAKAQSVLDDVAEKNNAGGTDTTRRVFYQSETKVTCASIARDKEQQGVLSALCCDGGEPRCSPGVSMLLSSESL